MCLKFNGKLVKYTIINVTGYLGNIYEYCSYLSSMGTIGPVLIA